jgi:hypothetical protein
VKVEVVEFRIDVVHGKCVRGGACCYGESLCCLTIGKDAVAFAFVNCSSSEEVERSEELETSVETTFSEGGE